MLIERDTPICACAAGRISIDATISAAASRLRIERRDMVIFLLDVGAETPTSPRHAPLKGRTHYNPEFRRQLQTKDQVRWANGPMEHFEVTPFHQRRPALTTFGNR